jgi:hypothetical protein
MTTASPCLVCPALAVHVIEAGGERVLRAHILVRHVAQLPVRAQYVPRGVVRPASHRARSSADRAAPPLPQMRRTMNFHPKSNFSSVADAHASSAQSARARDAPAIVITEHGSLGWLTNIQCHTPDAMADVRRKDRIFLFDVDGTLTGTNDARRVYTWPLLRGAALPADVARRVGENSGQPGPRVP